MTGYSTRLNPTFQTGSISDSQKHLRLAAKPPNVFSRKELGAAYIVGPSRDVASYFFLDSESETQLTADEFRTAVASCSPAGRSPIVLNGTPWGFWGLDDSGRVCVFRREGAHRIGQKTSFVDPAQYGNFSLQIADPVRLQTQCEFVELRWYFGSRIPQWVRLARQELHQHETSGLCAESFVVCRSDAELAREITNCDPDRWSAMVRGHLCFVHNRFTDRWVVFRDDTVVERNVDLASMITSQEDEQQFTYFLESIRRETNTRQPYRSR